MQRKSLVILIAVAVAAAGAAAWHFSDRPAAAAADLVLYGNVDIRQVQLAFNGAERIVRMQVREGDRVRKGELLASLDAVRLARTADLQQAQLAAQQQVVARLEAGSRPEEIAKAQAEFEAARIDADNAARSYRRLAALVAQHFVARQQADDARAAAAAAQAKRDSLQQSLKLARLGPRREDIAAAQAILRADQAALALARKGLADADLYAPEDGVIQERILEPGDMASPQRPVYTLALTAPLWVRVYVRGPDLGKLKPGMSAWVSTDSFPGKRYRAWLGYVSPTAEFTPKSVETTEVRSSLVYQARIFVCNAHDELRLGMPATVTLPLDQTPGQDAGRCRDS